MRGQIKNLQFHVFSERKLKKKKSEEEKKSMKINSKLINQKLKQKIMIILSALFSHHLKFLNFKQISKSTYRNQNEKISSFKV